MRFRPANIRVTRRRTEAPLVPPLALQPRIRSPGNPITGCEGLTRVTPYQESARLSEIQARGALSWVISSIGRCRSVI
jgi:hypothetical protein